MFKNVIARSPSPTMVDGLTTNPQLGKVDFDLAAQQYNAYIDAIKSLGIEVTLLEPSEEFPDSCFVEDPAVVTPEVAVITNPGASTRKHEIELIEQPLRDFFGDRIERITNPGTLEGGDVMLVDKTFYVGKSARTNDEGFRQFKEIMAKYGYDAVQVPLSGFIHLKTGCSFIAGNDLLVSSEFYENPAFANFNKLFVPDEEDYAANSMMMNGTVFLPSGFPTVAKMVEDAGYTVKLLDMSEFRKIDGSLTCLSLRF